MENIEQKVWIFRYVRADFEEIDMGPYTTREKAAKASKKMADFGALCSSPLEVPKNYELYKGE